MADVDFKPTVRPSTELNQHFIPTLQPLLLWQSLSLFWLCGLMAARFPLGGVICALIICSVDKRLIQKARLCVAICLFLLGFFAIHHLMPQRPDYPSWAMQGQKPSLCRIEGIVTKVEGLADKRLRITLRDVRSLEHEDAAPLPGLMLWTWEAKRAQKNFEQIHHPIKPLPGQKVQISARIRTTESFQNWGIMDFGVYWQNKGIFWRIWSRGLYGNPEILDKPTPMAKLRQNALSSIEQILFPPQAPLQNHSLSYQAKAFLPALLFGDKYHLNNTTMQYMQAASLIHSLALSGQHLALVGVGAMILTICIYLIFPHISLILPRTKWIGLLSLPLAALYLWLGNAPPSLIRAGLMLCLSVIFYWRMRMITLNDVLLMTLLLITCYNPLAIFDMGLQLSVLCVASIALAMPILRRIPKPNLQNISMIKAYGLKFGRGILQILIISLVIQLALLPVFLLYFNPSGTWFMLNIFWLPILGFWVLPLAALGLGTACLWPTAILTEHILLLAAWPCEILLKILHFMNSVDLFNFPPLLRPHWTALPAWIAICIALAWWVGRVRLIQQNKTPPITKTLVLVGMLLLFTGPIIRYAGYWQHDEIQVEMLDVGQGQAICISLSGGVRILVDGGGSFSPRFDTGANLVIPRLLYNAPPRLWAVINTHPDMDHLRGLMAVLEKVEVQAFYHNGQDFGRTYSSKIKDIQKEKPLLPMQTLATGMSIPLPSINNNITLEVLNPPPAHNLSANNASVVLRLVHENNNIKKGIALLCADAEIPALQYILDSKQDIAADILIVAHHGSRDALLPSFYKKSKAQVALVSAAKYNNHALPHFSVQNNLRQHNIPIYNTAHNGAINVTWRNSNAIYDIKAKPTTSSLRIKTCNNSTGLALQNFLR